MADLRLRLTSQWQRAYTAAALHTLMGINPWTRCSRSSELFDFSEGLRLQRGFNLEAPLLKERLGNEFRVLVATRPLTKTS